MYQVVLRCVVLPAALLFIAAAAQAKFVVVSPNGDALQQAFDNAEAGDIFFLKNGTYERTGSNAMFSLPTNARQNSIDNITIIGESRDGVRIVADTAGTADFANTMYLRGNDWYVENITVENMATKAQARALRTRGDRMIFNNVKQLSHQDTHNANGGMQYCFKCETWGDVDFIYGDAAIMYDSSLIVSRKRQGGYITAPEDSKTLTGTFKHGTLIKNSELRAEEGLADNTCTLGRPWAGNSSSVFFNCKMGAHIKPEGWTAWDNGNKPGIYMAEWSSQDLNGDPLSTSSRVAWSTQLTASDTSKYSIEFFFKGWNPLIKVNSQLLDAPVNKRIDGNMLRWDLVPNAMGYLVFRNGALLDFAPVGEYDVSGQTGETYTIKTVNELGRPGSDALLKTAQLITWSQELAAVVGDANIVLSATTSSGLPIVYTTNAPNVANIVSGNELQILSAGEVTITAMQAGNDEYVATAVSKTFSVQKVSQTITWEQELSAAVGGSMVLNATASSGLAVSYSSSAPSVARVVNGNELQALSVGEVTITANQNGNAATYAAAASVPKTFTVSRASQAITWEQSLSLVVGENIALEATSSSGLPISFSVDNTEVASIFAGFLMGKKDGVATVTATQAGNANYSAVTLDRTVTVGNGGGVTSVGENKQLPVQVYPNPADDLLNLSFESEGAYNISLSDMNGVVVYKARVGGALHAIDVSSYASGTYLLYVEDAQKKRTVLKIAIK